MCSEKRTHVYDCVLYTRGLCAPLNSIVLSRYFLRRKLLRSNRGGWILLGIIHVSVGEMRFNESEKKQARIWYLILELEGNIS